jgi:hypothetical protein
MRCVFKVLKRFGKHFSCYLQGGCLGGFAMKVATTTFAETSGNFQHSMELIPERRSCTLKSSLEYLKTSLTVVRLIFLSATLLLLSRAQCGLRFYSPNH